LAQSKDTDLKNHLKEFNALYVTMAKSAIKEYFFHRISRITTRNSIPKDSADLLWCCLLDGFAFRGLEPVDVIVITPGMQADCLMSLTA
jgi:hypothetical protein